MFVLYKMKPMRKEFAKKKNKKQKLDLSALKSALGF